MICDWICKNRSSTQQILWTWKTITLSSKYFLSWNFLRPLCYMHVGASYEPSLESIAFTNLKLWTVKVGKMDSEEDPFLLIHSHIWPLMSNILPEAQTQISIQNLTMFCRWYFWIIYTCPCNRRQICRTCVISRSAWKKLCVIVLCCDGDCFFIKMLITNLTIPLQWRRYYQAWTCLHCTFSSAKYFALKLQFLSDCPTNLLNGWCHK